MAAFLKDWGPLISWLLSSGALLGAAKSLYDALKKRGQGVAVKDTRRRHDIVFQRDQAIAEAEDYRDAYFDLRSFCQRHTPTDYMPPIPLNIRNRMKDKE